MSDFDESSTPSLAPKSPQSYLRTRIIAVQKAHMPDQYEQDMGECPCGFKYSVSDELAEHVADAVIRELGRYEYAVATADMDFICMYADERSELDGLQLHPGEQIVRRYVTDWTADE